MNTKTFLVQVGHAKWHLDVSEPMTSITEAREEFRAFKKAHPSEKYRLIKRVVCDTVVK